jgi:hypothetical protein
MVQPTADAITLGPGTGELAAGGWGTIDDLPGGWKISQPQSSMARAAGGF